VYYKITIYNYIDKVGDKLKNNKGFTLIELIATITILSIIMLIAVPNVISIVNKNKNQTYINDARKMVALARYKFELDASIMKPQGSDCVVMELEALDRTELNKGPENGVYDLNRSFVVIKYDSTNQLYDYMVQIVEKYDKGQKGVLLTNYSELVKVNAKNDYVKSEGFLDADSSIDYGCESANIYPKDDD